MLFYKAMSILKRYKKWGYSECDYLNNALRVLLKEPQKNKFAIEEICWAIKKTNGYFYDDIASKLYDEYKMQIKQKNIKE